MKNMWQDVRYAWRLLRRNPATSLAALGTLAIGIGATTAIFSVVHAALFRKLPFPEPDRIVVVYETVRRSGLTHGVANPANFDYWEHHASSFARMAATRGMSMTLTGAGDADRIRTQFVTPAFFGVAGIAPAIGRSLTDADAGPSPTRLLISHRLWISRLGADPSVLTRTITLDGQPWNIAGVMPEGFSFPRETEAWLPLYLPADQRANGGAWFLGVVARLAPGVTIQQAQAEMDTLSAQLERLHAQRQKGRGAYVVGLHADLVDRVADGLTLLQGAVAVVLLIAVVNVANLLIAQGTGRRREFTIRAALGAARGRLVRQLLTESLLLGISGAAGGVLLAVWGVRALVALSPMQLPETMQPGIDGPVLVFALAAGMLASLLFGVAPALLASRADLAAPIREASHTATPGARAGGGRIRSLLVIAEIALAIVLLMGAGLLIRSFRLLMTQPVGFNTDRLLTAQTTLPRRTYATADARLQFWQTLFERLQALPDVTAAGGSTALPFSRWEWQTDFKVIGREDVPNKGTGIRTVHPGYFATLGVPVLRGRAFDPGDSAGAERVVVVNEAFARAHLAGLAPIGQRIRFDREAGAPPAVIVGVIGDTRQFNLVEAPEPEVYRPLAQDPPSTLILAIRTGGDPRKILTLVRAAVHDVDRDLPVQELMTMDALIDRTIAERRFYMTLLALFSAVAAGLSIVGVYGVMAYAVGQRTREIGIRVALGAAPHQVQRLLVRSGAMLVAIGAVAGGAGALAAARLLRTLLFGVTPGDPLTLAAAIVVLGSAALAAAYVPARRARRLDPMAALRQE